MRNKLEQIIIDLKDNGKELFEGTGHFLIMGGVALVGALTLFSYSVVIKSQDSQDADLALQKYEERYNLLLKKADNNKNGLLDFNEKTKILNKAGIYPDSFEKVENYFLKPENIRSQWGSSIIYDSKYIQKKSNELHYFLSELK